MELGLRGYIYGCEPMWLPEQVFEAHPEWRGPRCEHPLRSRKPYHSMCIDHPEVLAMYKESASVLAKAANVDLFTFLTNDSGAGVCWSEGLYPGANGPSRCKHRTLPQRISGWMSAIQEGAASAGVEAAEISLLDTIPVSEVQYVGSSLGEGQYIAHRRADGSPVLSSAGFANYLYGSKIFPLKEVPQIVQFGEQLEMAFGSNSDHVMLCFPSKQSVELFELYRQFRDKPRSGLAGRVQLLHGAAAALAGSEAADELLAVWEHISKAIDAIKVLDNGGPVLLLGAVGQRWLTRPLVPFPGELTAEEKAYYRGFQFQARMEEHAADLMDCQAAKVIHGRNGTWMAHKLLTESLASLKQAIRGTERLSKIKVAEGAQVQGQTQVDYASLLLRLRVLSCLLRTVQHKSEYQELLERSNTGLIEPEVDRGGTARVLPVDMQFVVRAEMDNMEELILLLESGQENPLLTASRKEDETVFLLGPDLIAQLRMKIAFMKRYYMDHRRLIGV